MTNRAFVKCLSIAVVGLLFVAGCAPKVTFYVTKPPKLPIHGVESIAIGVIEDDLKSDILLPGNPSSSSIQRARTLSPKIDQFSANHQSAPLVQSLLLSGLSKSGQYQIIQTDPLAGNYNGVIANPEHTAIINAKVRFFDVSKEDAENKFHLLIATKRNLEFKERLALLGLKATVISEAERSKKGFKVKTPYIESVAAMEIEFDLIRQSDGKKLINTQTFRSYFTQKWGGDPRTSHLPEPIRQIILTQYQPQTTLFDDDTDQPVSFQMAFTNPDAFLARGGKLMNHPDVPLNTLDTQSTLAKEIVSEYLKQISQYTVQTTLSIASGDPIAVNFLNGNAYELAINRLELIQRTEEDSFNLALAYESIAEYSQAAKYYREALKKNSGNSLYRESLKRVTAR